MSKKITRQQIIQATAKVISEKGLENTNIEDIAHKAGIAKGSVYNYFESKEKLLFEGSKLLAKQRIDVLHTLLANYDTALVKIRVLLWANRKMFKDNKDLFLMNYALLLSSNEDLRKEGAIEYFRRYVDFVAEIIEAGIREGVVRGGDSKIMALMIVLTNDIGGIVNDQLEEDYFDEQNLEKELMGILTE